MNQEDAAEFSRAVNLAATDKTAAYAILNRLSSKYPDNTLATLWLAFTSPNLTEAEQAVQMAENQSPTDPNVRAARQWLQGEKLKAPANPPTPVRTADFRSAPVLPAIPTADFNPAPVSATASETVATQNDPGYKVINHALSSEFKRPSEVLNIGPEAQTQTTGNGWVNPTQPDMPTLRDALVKSKSKGPRKPISSLTILAGILAVLIIAFIICGVYFFVLNPTSTISDTVFDKAALPVFSELEKLDLTQSIKDQMTGLYGNTGFAQFGVKVTQLDIYKIKTTSSEADFIKFYRSELDKAGWNIQTLPTQNANQQPLLFGTKSHSYIMLGSSAPGTATGELKAQLAPNQSVAFAMLFEQLPPTPNP